MEFLKSEWFLRTLIGAIFTVVGFFGKAAFDNWQQYREASAMKLERLKELASLLDESYSLFLNQNYQVKRLMASLHSNHGTDVPRDLGYDETFFQMHDEFTPDEAELQKLIRSTTMNSLRRVNGEIREWLVDAHEFKNPDQQPAAERKRLAEELQILELHLNQWHDKYNAFLPEDPRRSLVYLGDEKQHGRRFPQSLAPALDAVISSWR